MESWSKDVQKAFAMILGILMLALAYFVDQMRSDGFSQWLYVFGSITLFNGMMRYDRLVGTKSMTLCGLD